MTTTDDRPATVSTTAAGGRHRRNDLPPDGVLADAMRAWRTRGTGRGRGDGMSAAAPTPQPAGGAQRT